MKKITLLITLLMCSVGFSQPTDNATTPPARDAVDVISIYGETYTNITGVNYNPDWGQSGIAGVNTAYDPGTGNLVLAYPNFNYQGTDFASNAQAASSMEFLHVDLWTDADSAASIVQVSPINNGTGTGETLVTISHTAGEWTSVDIPIGDFTGMTWDSVFQMKFAANGAGSATPIDIYLDNIYFWKAPTAAGTDATLSDLLVDGATVAGFSANNENYTVVLPNGTTTVPTVTATTTDVGATTVITPAGSLPGDTTVVVTAADNTTTKTYTVSFNFPIELPLDFEGTIYDATTLDGATVSNGTGNDVLEIVGSGAAWDRAIITFTTPVDLSDDANNTLSFTFQSTTAAPGEVHQHGISFQDGAGGPFEMNFITTGQEVASLELDFAAGLGEGPTMHIFTDVNDFGTQSGTGGTSGQGTNTLSGTYIMDNVALGASTTAPTCDDGIQNGDETGVDCGGSCPNACPPTEPATGAPTPTAPMANVGSSIFSDTYGEIAGTDFDPNWGQTTDATIVDIAGNNTLKYAGLNYQGTDFSATPQDVSTMTHVHVDYWTPDATSLQFFLINKTSVDPDPLVTEEVAFDLTPNLMTGQWVSTDIPMSNFAGRRIGLTSIVQLKVVGNGTVFLDNIYFTNDPALGVDDLSISDFAVYPNPTQNEWNIKTNGQDITSVQVFDMLGKNVISLTPNRNSVEVDASNLPAGLYFARLTSESGTKSVKLVKQ